MTVSTEITTLPKSINSRNSNCPVQIRMKSKSQFEYVQQVTEKSEFLNLVDFGDVAFSVETVIHTTQTNTQADTHRQTKTLSHTHT